ncbi:MAG TPA: hypothetical protein VFE60_01260 [Roseiarcus sp.]|nr:hypothetical protein [Roseiarcus sp.]
MTPKFISRSDPAAQWTGERAEVAPPVVSQHDRFAVDERPVHRQTADRLGDP